MHILPKNIKIRPVVLSGGAGTRLWPLSRRRYPKQFLPLIGHDCLFARTLHLASPARGFAVPMVVGNAEHQFFMKASLDRAEGGDDALMLLEPEGKNTAAAAIVAALAETDDDVLHLVMPSDHVIADQAAFLEAVARAAVAAKAGHFVLFGMKPSYPETGYGYIVAASENVAPDVQRIQTFREKPDEVAAEKLLEQGALWNSGIFLYAPKLLRDEAQRLAPEQLKLCAEALEKAERHGVRVKIDAATYHGLESHPFDKLIMERTDKGAVVPCDIGWSDVGSWQSLWQAAEKDAKGNAFVGPVSAVDVTNSYVRSDGPRIAVIGLDNVAVVATKDAILVTPQARSQEVKQVLTEVETQQPDASLEHPTVIRPWGAYESLAQGPGFQVKHIVVKPGQSLSLQMHHHRAEHWVVVRGTAVVTCDDKEKMIFPNESIFIPQGARHRLANPGKIDLHLIEVQSGDYVGEDDIVRFNDVYGR